ncbi:MAG TPA: twin-arginine translocase subunit TatC [Anaerolineales bacterium]|nr:twin-arginine translocase subunit TatC [Anaerolineales bacterium]
MTNPKQDIPLTEMSLWEHLKEARTRLIRIFIAIVLFSMVGFALGETILTWMLAPYVNLLSKDGGVTTIEAIGPTEPVSIYLQISLGIGVALALPYITAEIIGFILPGLKPNEKRWVWLIVPSAFLLFLAGAGFAWWLLIPTAVQFLQSFLSNIITSRWTAREYVPFVVQLTFWLGMAFEMPLVAFFLASLRLLTPKAMLKQWRIAVVLCAVIAAMITPTIDPVNMTLVWVPLIVLYFFSVLLASIPYLARTGE